MRYTLLNNMKWLLYSMCCVLDNRLGNKLFCRFFHLCSIQFIHNMLLCLGYIYDIFCGWTAWLDSIIGFLLADLILYSWCFCLINFVAQCLDSITLCLAATLTLFVACTCGLDLTEASWLFYQPFCYELFAL